VWKLIPHENPSKEEPVVNELLTPEDAESVSIGGVEVSFRLSGRETDGAYAVLEFLLEPGRLIPPHAHCREHEVSYVLEGEIGLRIGAEELTAKAGCVVVKRPQIPHAWWNTTASRARVLEVISPGRVRTLLSRTGRHPRIPTLSGTAVGR